LQFETTKQTLQSEPESMLAAMFSGRYPFNTDQEGYVFIDRNGKYFEFILEYVENIFWGAFKKISKFCNSNLFWRMGGAKIKFLGFFFRMI
jgi:hypothetical protein